MNRGERTADWLVERSWLVIGASLVLTVGLSAPMLLMTPDTTASQNPGGVVVETQDIIDERFVSDVFGAGFIVEARDGNALARDVLLELRENSEALRSDPGLAPKLFGYYSAEIGDEITGIYSIADEADARLREAGVDGLAAASQSEVDQVVASLINASQPSVWGLTQEATVDPSDGSWSSPALFVSLVADNEALGGGGQAITLGGDDSTKEEFARDAQSVLRGDARTYQAWGVAIDVNLTVGEQAAAAGPFIGFTILAVLIVAGLILKSYWAVAVLGAGLGALMIWLKGISNLIGLENDQVLSFIVPIAMISFGIDFAFHAIGRYREEMVQTYRPRPAFVLGMGGVLAALVLALASDSAAFLSNVTSGIESIVQFGIAAAIALVAAFFVLGIVTPLVLMHINEGLGTEASTGIRRIGREFGSGLAATGAMAVVLFLVYLLPAVGVALWAVHLLTFVVGPYLIARRRRGDTTVTVAIPAQLQWPLIGKISRTVASRRAIVLPVIGVAWIVSIFVAVQIEPRFDVKDFFAADTDFVVSLDKLDEHLGQQGGEPATIYVEGDLTQPEALAAIEAFVQDVASLDEEELAVDHLGTTSLEGGVLNVIHDVMQTPFAVEAIGATTGTTPTDSNGDGLPDTPDQVAAIYAFAGQAGIPLDAQRLIQTPGAVGLNLWQSDDGSLQATVMTVGVVGSRSQENVAGARDALEPLVADLRESLQAVDPDSSATLTGSAIVRDEQLSAISRALIIALPISVLACLILGSAFMRSLRLGAVSVVPILVVVAWLYAFMHLAGYGINVVTGTIGAVSIGIGIDFAIHFIMRYREELGRLGTRLGAIEAAGTGTGAALAASALSSVVGFAIMALAPMPMFSAYGFLTAIMIVMALVATLLVLPGLLLLVSREQAPTTQAEVASVTAGAS